MFKESKGQGDRHLAREGDSPPAVDESRAGWTARGPAHRSKQFRFHPMNDGKAAPGLEQRSDAIWSVCASPALAAVGRRGCREVRQAASGGRGGCPGAEAGGGGKNLSGRGIPATRSWLSTEKRAEARLPPRFWLQPPGRCRYRALGWTSRDERPDRRAGRRRGREFSLKVRRGSRYERRIGTRDKRGHLSSGGKRRGPFGSWRCVFARLGQRLKQF